MAQTLAFSSILRGEAGQGVAHSPTAADAVVAKRRTLFAAEPA